MLKKIIIGLIALVLVAVGVGFAFSGSANASEGDQPCVPSDAYDEVIHHDAVTHVVHHDAVTHVVHHDAVPATPDLWWNWSPNKDQGPFDGPPAFPNDERGTWQGPHENGGPDQDTFGTFNSSNGDNGRASWFHRDHGTPGVDAYDETVVDSEAYDETVVDQEAYDETVHHDAVTCGPGDKPEPLVRHYVERFYQCGLYGEWLFAHEVTTDWVLADDGETWVLGEPVDKIVNARLIDHPLVPCKHPHHKPPHHNPPAPQLAPPVKRNAPVPTVIDAGL